MWLGVEESAGFIEKRDAQIGKAVQFGPTIGDIIEKHRDIVIRIGVGVAACS